MANENLSILKRIVAQVKEPAPRLDSVEKRITALKDIVKLLDAQVSKEDFIKAFEAVLGYVRDIRAENQQEMAEMRRQSSVIYADLRAANADDVTALATEVNQTMSEQVKAIDAKLHEADVVLHLMKQVKDGKQGPPGESIVGPMGPQGPAGSPDTAEDIRNKLELLTGEDRLDASAVRGLEDLVKETKTVISGGLTRMKTDSLYTKFVGGASTITVSATQPSNPELHDLWVDIS